MSGDENLTVEFSLTPALNVELFFPNLVGQFNDFKLQPNPIRLIWLLCKSHIYIADIPSPVHRQICSALDFLAPALGMPASTSKQRVKVISAPLMTCSSINLGRLQAALRRVLYPAQQVMFM